MNTLPISKGPQGEILEGLRNLQDRFTVERQARAAHPLLWRIWVWKWQWAQQYKAKSPATNCTQPLAE